MPTIDQAVRNLEQLKLDLPKIVGNEMISFALDNIRAESWEGKNWDKRKKGAPRDNGRNLLIDTGDGRRSIEVKKATLTETELTANDYMQAHNEGARIKGTFNVRTQTRKRKGRTEQVQAHTRTVDTKLPERRYTGESKVQTERIQKVITQRIINALT